MRRGGVALHAYLQSLSVRSFDKAADMFTGIAIEILFAAGVADFGGYITDYMHMHTIVVHKARGAWLGSADLTKYAFHNKRLFLKSFDHSSGSGS